MFSTSDELLHFINMNSHAEGRGHEFKEGRSWHDLKKNITKAALAMVNLQDGGIIIIGVQEKSNPKRFIPTGMSKADSDTYDLDTVSIFINNYADPHIDIECKTYQKGSKYYVVIKIFEFEDTPVICKKKLEVDDICKAQIYYRRHRRIESSSVLSVSELREIVDLAIDKGIKKQITRIRTTTGIKTTTNNDSFKDERGSF